jgi:hypothetical protein
MLQEPLQGLQQVLLLGLQQVLLLVQSMGSMVVLE